MAIQYVGGQVAGRANGSSNLVVNFALTGGLAALPAAGDIVVICVVVGSAGGNPALAISSPFGYFTLGTQINVPGATADVSMQVSYKRMDATPDTSFTLPGTGNAAFGQAYSVQVFRGVHTSTALDVAAVSASATGTGRPDPPSITPITAGAWVVICGGGASGTGANFVAPANFATNFLTANGADTTDATVGSGYWSGWVSGAVNPASYTGGSTTSTNSWGAWTLALRPAPEDIVGDFSKTLGSVTVNADGTVTESGVSGSLSKSLGSLQRSVSGEVLVQGSSSKTLGSLQRSASGQALVQGAFSKTLGSLQRSASGETLVQGASSQTLGILSVDSDGTVQDDLGNQGVLSETLGSLQASVSGEVPVAGVLSETLGDLQPSGSAEVSVVGALSKTLGSLSTSSSGTTEVRGDLTKSLESLSLDASGLQGEFVAGSLSGTLGLAEVIAWGDVTGEAVIPPSGHLFFFDNPKVPEEEELQLETVGTLHERLGSLRVQAHGLVGIDATIGTLHEKFGVIRLKSAGKITDDEDEIITLAAMFLVIHEHDQPQQ